MDPLLFFAVCAGVFLGNGAGFLLSIIAPEELKPGERYLRVLQKILFSILIACFGYQLYHGFWVSLLFFAAALSFTWKIPILQKVYAALPYILIFETAFLNEPGLGSVAAFSFLLNMATTTIAVKTHAEKKKLFAMDEEKHVVLKDRLSIAKSTLGLPFACFGIASFLFLLVSFF